MSNAEKKLKEQLGIREAIKGYYEGCPSQHQSLRMLIEEGKGVQCLGCMQTFGKAKQDPEQEWDRLPKAAKRLKYLTNYTSSTMAVPAEPPVPGQFVETALGAMNQATQQLQQAMANHLFQQQMAGAMPPPQPAPIPPDYGATWDWAGPAPGNPEPGN